MSSDQSNLQAFNIRRQNHPISPPRANHMTFAIGTGIAGFRRDSCDYSEWASSVMSENFHPVWEIQGKAYKGEWEERLGLGLIIH